jgi:hypothetical protein
VDSDNIPPESINNHAKLKNKNAITTKDHSNQN